MAEFSLGRRRFLVTIATAAGGAAVLGIGSVAPHGGDTLEWLARARLSRRLGTMPGITALGSRYLAERAEEVDAGALASRIFSDPDELHPDLGDEGLERLLRSKIRNDFAEERVVRVHRWVLSQTELRLCALVALLAE